MTKLYLDFEWKLTEQIVWEKEFLFKISWSKILSKIFTNNTFNIALDLVFKWPKDFFSYRNL